jgi:uncharacterized membrane protein YdjX (TVP38/TMEM64 family)
MDFLMIVPLTGAIAAMGLYFGSFMGFFLASLATVVTSLFGVIGLVLLL